MCLGISKDKKPRVKTAKEDILVYKVIRKSQWGIYYSLVIDGRDCRWQKGYHYTESDFSDCLMKGFWNPWIVNGDAFHTKKTRELAHDLCIASDDRKIVEIYIPKGAKYYENEEDYASSDLVWYK